MIPAKYKAGALNNTSNSLKPNNKYMSVNGPFTRSELLTRWGWMTNICGSKWDHHWFRQWVLAWSVPNHYVTQSWHVVNRTPGNQFQWNLNKNTIIFKEKNIINETIRLGLDVLMWMLICICTLHILPPVLYFLFAFVISFLVIVSFMISSCLHMLSCAYISFLCLRIKTIIPCPISLAMSADGSAYCPNSAAGMIP